MCTQSFSGCWNPLSMHFEPKYSTKYTQPCLLHTHLGLPPLSAYIPNGSPLMLNHSFYFEFLDPQIPYIPFDSRTSEVSLMVKGKSLGMTARRPFSASAP